MPTRHLWDKWEDFITGGPDGQFDEAANPPPRWNPSSTDVGSLWDYFGFPTGVVPTGALPLRFPLSAYNEIWNEYYRDEKLHARGGARSRNGIKKMLGERLFRFGATMAAARNCTGFADIGYIVCRLTDADFATSAPG